MKSEIQLKIDIIEKVVKKLISIIKDSLYGCELKRLVQTRPLNETKFSIHI